MNYPIFNSVVNQIESELQKRNIKIVASRIWTENTINATGLETEIDISQMSDYIENVTINFDWDKFREVNLARRLDGMNKHPLLNDEQALTAKVKPNIDIELMWHFREKIVRNLGPSKIGTERVETASLWMEEINHQIQSFLTSDNIITRWHIEIEGDLYGRYLSAMSLISYYQFTFEHCKTLNDIHHHISRTLQYLLMVAQKVILVANDSIPTAA